MVKGQDETTLKRMKNFMRLLAVAMVPLTGGMPMVSNSLTLPSKS